MNHECDELKELYGPYALGVLSGLEKEPLEKHLRVDCPNCRSGVRAAINDTLALALAVGQQEPPARVKEELLQRVRLASSTASEAANPWKWLAIAAMIALVVVLTGGIGRISHLREEVYSQRRANADLQRMLDTQQQSLAQQQKLIAYLRESDVVLIPLKATSRDLRYGASAIWGKQGLLLMVKNLPVPPQDKTYQLWAITKDNKPVSAGIFKTNENGEAMYEASSLPARSETKLLAVTLEPDGGRPEPTLPPIMASPPISAP